MLELGAGLVDGGDPIELHSGRMAEPAQLGEDEPHPVALLVACIQLRQGNVEDWFLCRDEALQILGTVGH